MNKLLSFLTRTHQPDIEALSAHVDGRLDAARSADLTAHLAACAACRARLSELQATRSLVQSLPEAELPRSFRLRAPGVEHVPAPVYTKRSTALRFAPALGALAAVVWVVAIGVDSFSGGSSGASMRTSGSRAAYFANAPTASSQAGDLNADSGATAAAAAQAQSNVTPPPSAANGAAAPPDSDRTSTGGATAAQPPAPANAAPQAPGTAAATATRSSAAEGSAPSAGVPGATPPPGIAARNAETPGTSASSKAAAPARASGGDRTFLIIEIIAAAVALAAAGVTIGRWIRNREADR